ncbi:MAG: hypothetical protein ORN83_06740 [Chthoniobacteraceae bacterium]|nr:hypothetical protein [Chthoniobacteraceae bacterium]
MHQSRSGQNFQPVGVSGADLLKIDQDSQRRGVLTITENSPLAARDSNLFISCRVT